MCEAEVKRRPSATKRNSPVKPSPVRNPWKGFTTVFQVSLRTYLFQRSTSAAATPERIETCIMGETSSPAALIATCWSPQMKQRTTAVSTAAPSTGRRIGAVGMLGVGMRSREKCGWENFPESAREMRPAKALREAPDRIGQAFWSWA